MDGGPGIDDGRVSPVVLIVGDEDSAAMYAIFLLAMGFQSVTAQSAEDGFDRACAIRPHIVVLDMLRSDNASAFTLTRRLRSDTRTKDAGIILLAGHALGSVRQEANEAGCDRFLLKPCLPDVLALEIVDLLRQRRDREPAPASPRAAGNVLHVVADGDTKACPKCRGALMFAAHPVLTIGAIFEREGAQIVDRIRYEGAWVCRSDGCDYRELLGERIA